MRLLKNQLGFRCYHRTDPNYWYFYSLNLSRNCLSHMLLPFKRKRERKGSTQIIHICSLWSVPLSLRVLMLLQAGLGGGSFPQGTPALKLSAHSRSRLCRCWQRTWWPSLGMALMGVWGPGLVLCLLSSVRWAACLSRVLLAMMFCVITDQRQHSSDHD